MHSRSPSPEARAEQGLPNWLDGPQLRPAAVKALPRTDKARFSHSSLTSRDVPSMEACPRHQGLGIFAKKGWKKRERFAMKAQGCLASLPGCVAHYLSDLGFYSLYFLLF